MTDLDIYRAEALGEPFVLQLDDGHLLTIQRPPVELLLSSHTAGTTRGLLDLICGHHASELIAAVAGDDLAVLQAIAADLRRYFGVNDAARLAWLLDRYGPAIEADLRPQGIDFLDLWRGGLSPRTLLNLIDRLPRSSHYQEALAQDEELAAGAVEKPPGQPTPPPLTEFTPEVEALAVVVDRLGDLINANLSVNGGKPTRIPRYPRPVTAADQIKARRRREAMDDLERRLFPTGAS